MVVDAAWPSQVKGVDGVGAADGRGDFSAALPLR
jgi:hypothetical protein